MSTRVLLVDDDLAYREGLRALLLRNGFFEQVHLAADGNEAIGFLATAAVDVVLMDINMPNRGGISATEVLHERYPRLPIVMLTSFGVDGYLREALRAGASGFLSKSMPISEIADGLRRAVVGQRVWGREAQDALVSSFVSHLEVADVDPQFRESVESLEIPKMRIVQLVAEAKTDAQIAAITGLAPGTVRTYLSSVRRELGCRSRTELAVRTAACQPDFNRCEGWTA